MKIKALSNCNQIGGNVIEISNDTTKIVIDFGKDLNNDAKKDIKGLTYGKSMYDAVFISHYHEDHIGLIHTINTNIPIYIDSQAYKIYQVTQDFLNKKHSNNILNLTPYNQIQIKSIKITPYLIDHSAYNAYMFYIEDDDDSILFTGDFRITGYKKNLIKLVYRDCKNVNKLIIEGTNVQKQSSMLSESYLQLQAEEIMKQYDNILILQSSTNIDRIVSFYKAATHQNKIFIEDLFTANITKILKNHIPNTEFSNVYTFCPKRYFRKPKVFKDKYINPLQSKMRGLVFSKPYVFLIKSSMIDDIKNLYHKGLMKNTCLIYSMWEGYKPSLSVFLDEITKLNIPIISLHTSGHATRQEIDQLILIINPNYIYPIHTEHYDVFKEIYGDKVVQFF